MNLRRGLAALGATTMLLGATTLAASPASASPTALTCGQTYQLPAMDLGPFLARGYTDFTVSCRTLAGDVKAWTVKGKIWDSFTDNWRVKLQVTIGGRTSTVSAGDGMGWTESFTFTGSGPSASANAFAS